MKTKYQVSWYNDRWLLPGGKTRDFYDLKDAEWFKRYIQVTKQVMAHISKIETRLL